MPKDNMSKRASKSINEKEYYVYNPERGTTRRFNHEKHIEKAKKVLLAAVLGTAVLTTSLTALVTTYFSEEISDFKNQKQFDHYIQQAYNVDNEVRELVDEQGYCYRAYGGDMLHWICDKILIEKRCDDENCQTCNKNERLKHEIVEELSNDPEFSEIAEAREFYDGRGK
ncbi:MAG: hypothetical protein GX758_03720 [Tenericutes bacterium]|nr:hypothetical protein [Mycoplasmatota bacterium]